MLMSFGRGSALPRGDEHMNKKHRKLTPVMILCVIGIILVLSGIIAFAGYGQFTKVLEAQYNDSAYEVAETARNYLNPEKFDEYLATGVKDEEYLKIEKMLDELVVATDCNFIYVDRLDDSLTVSTYIYDSVNPSTGFSRYPLGYVAADMDPEYVEEAKQIKESGERPEKYMYSYSESGAHTTAALGVKDSSGEVIGIICVEKPMTRLVAARFVYLMVVAFIALGVAAIAVLLAILFLRRVIVRPVLEITREAERFASGDHVPAEKIKASENPYEIGLLARSLHKMEYDIVQYIDNLQRVTAEKERIGAELNVATQIQADMLPRIFPPFPERPDIHIYASMNPAKEVGGDFYDFFMIDKDHLGLVMADVSGKGVPAALFMVIAKTLIKNYTLMGGSPREILENVNEQLCEGNEAELFVTVWLAVLDLSTGKGVAANAGHEHPAIRRKGGDFELIKYRHSPAVATMEGMKFREHSFELNKGDCLFVYTDGVTEATNASNELYGEERLRSALNASKDLSMKAIVTNVRKDIDQFVGDAVQFDDITMMAFCYTDMNEVTEGGNE